MGGRIACKSASTRWESTLKEAIPEVSKCAELKFLERQSGYFFVTPLIAQCCAIESQRCATTGGMSNPNALTTNMVF